MRATLAALALLAPSGSATMERSAYCLGGITATGYAVGHGTVAVDPAVIPLGSRVWVAGYGYGWARDTGGAIRGRMVDVWVASCFRARVIGRGRVLVRWWVAGRAG